MPKRPVRQDVGSLSKKRSIRNLCSHEVIADGYWMFHMFGSGIRGDKGFGSGVLFLVFPNVIGPF